MDKEIPGIILNDSEGNPDKIFEVKDSFETPHKIKKILGQGGQGVVCRTANPEIVVKFALDPKGQLISRKKNKEAFEKNDSEFKAVISKPFPERIHLAYPMARLQDYSGYVMRLMGDMTSFTDLVPADVQDLEKIADDGGHRRRFELLSKLAALLAKLHGNGMVYCDISPNNVFITKDPLFPTQNVWLIDADNIFIPGDEPAKLVYTPRYAAPELFEGQPCSASSDIYSFATLAFESLAALHPFAGDKASNWNDEADAWDAETNKNEEAKSFDIDPRYSGKHPWVEDVKDKSNHTDNGLPRQNFLTDETFALFNMTFSEEGRQNPKTRPTAALWARAFAHSHASSIRCPKCGWSIVYDGSQKTCSWCDEKIPKLLVLKDESGKIVFAQELSGLDKDSGEIFNIPEHIFSPFNIDNFYKTALKAHPVNRNGFGIEFIKTEFHDGQFFIAVNGKEEKITAGRYSLQINKGEKYSLIHKDKAGSTTRSLTIEITEGK